LIFLGLLVVAAAVVLLVRRVEVRLVLFSSGLLMAALAGQPLLILDTFGKAMVAGVVAPICSAMGFAAVLTASGCDRQLVVALTRLLHGTGPWLAPASILVAYFCNLAIPSQAGTAAALGPVLVPLLRAAGLTPAQAGAALVLGASFGGELLNPAAQDVLAVGATCAGGAGPITALIVPSGIGGAFVAAFGYWFFTARRLQHSPEPPKRLPVNWLRAFMPLFPVTVLLLSYGGTPGLAWLSKLPEEPGFANVGSGLPVVRAMLLGTALVCILCWRQLQATSKEFYEGMGRAYGSVISLTITAQCFGAGLTAIGLTTSLLALVGHNRTLGILLAIVFPGALAMLSGSGSGPVLAFAQSLLPHMDESHQPTRIAALACHSGSFGRTLSPVAAVVIYTAGLVGVDPRELLKHVARPLLLGALASFVLALIW